MKQCSPGGNIITSKTDTIVTHDTLTLEGKTITKEGKPYPKYVFVADSNYYNLNACDSVRVYHEEYEDSLSKLTIYDSVLGMSIKMRYTLNIKDRQVITNDTLIRDSSFVSKKKWGLGYNYQIPIGTTIIPKTHNLTFKYKLF